MRHPVHVHLGYPQALHKTNWKRWNKIVMFLVVLLAVSAAHQGADPLLSFFASNAQPWLSVPAWSRQLPPVYTGLTPLQLARNASQTGATRVLPDFLAALAAAFVPALRAVLANASVSDPAAVELEVFPTYDDDTGYYTWAFARFRPSGGGAWSFLPAEQSQARPDIPPAVSGTAPVFPVYLDARRDFAAIFDSAAELPDLYAQPSFGNCVWINASGAVQAAWLDPEDGPLVERWRRHAPAAGLTCVVMPQPSRFGAAAETYVARLGPGGARLQLPAFVAFSPPLEPPSEPACKRVEVAFEESFESQWVGDIGVLARFTHKNSGDPSNRLAAMRGYLRSRYATLNISTFSVNASTYLGIADWVVVAVLPGSDPSLPPLLLCDHYDTAYAEDIFNRNASRVSTPGADDNDSATATLLAAAKHLRGLNLTRSVWLVHLCGEEFPADDLGARALDDFLMRQNIGVFGVVVMDMISWRRNASDTIVQVNSGRSKESLLLSSCFLAERPPGLTPTFRGRWDPFSYNFNTDAVIFDASGYPSLLINEHINYRQNFDRPYYHQSSDTVAHLDPHYGASVARFVLRGVANLCA